MNIFDLYNDMCFIFISLASSSRAVKILQSLTLIVVALYRLKFFIKYILHYLVHYPNT